MKERRIDWVNLVFLASAHAFALAGLVLTATVLPVRAPTVVLGVVWLLLTGISVTGGYHRLFAHMTYRASAPVRWLYLLWGAAAVQNSALKWATDHRRHHQETDQEKDPYNIRKGFLWAHVGWVVWKDPPSEEAPRAVPDLAGDPAVRFQDRWYLALAVFFGWLLPTALGALWGDALGAFFLVGFVRLVVLWHATFSINSVAHTLGRQPYSDRDSARDSFLTALVTLGEGYHNFHHTFPYDYRNGVRRHQFDPTKWWVRGLSFLGLTWNLKRVAPDVLLKARLEMDRRRLEAQLARRGRPAPVHVLESLQKLGEESLARWHRLREAYRERRRMAGRRQARGLAMRVRAAQRRFREWHRSWEACLRNPELVYALA